MSRAEGDPGRSAEAEGSVLGRLAALIESVEGGDSVFVLTHDNPDPDALAAAAAMAELLRDVTGQTPRLAFGGIVGRAENRALLQELGVEFERTDRIEIPAPSPIVLVDTQPRAGNHSLPPGRIVSAVVDHHPERPETTAAGYVDVRPSYGATASMLVEYLRVAGTDVARWLATALFYAIQSETQDLGREASEPDIAASAWLYPRSDPAALARIRHARVPASYFRALHGALDVARRHGRIVAIPMTALPYPDMVAEMADLFLQMNGVDWTVAAGRYRDRLLLSVRTYDGSAHAGSLMRAAIGDRGSAGGHGTFAGGQIDLRGVDDQAAQAIRDSVLGDIIEALGGDPEAPDPLVPTEAESQGGGGETP